jgi:5-formyltetrahydrofolate cyclo-ligase
MASSESEIASHLRERKKQLRSRFRFERSQRSLGGDWLHLLNANELRMAYVIASYISYGDEPDTTKLNQAILDSGKRLLLPQTDESGLIRWIIWSHNSTAEPSRRRGKRSGKNLQPVGDLHDGVIDVIIAPALRVDRSGVRLGQGGGSYDRAFAESNGERAWKVVLLHDEELSSELLPAEEHDIRVDAVALPEIVVRFKRN